MGVFLNVETQRKFLKTASIAELQEENKKLEERLGSNMSYCSTLLTTVFKLDSMIRLQVRKNVIVLTDHTRVAKLKDDLVFECEDLREDVGVAKEAAFNHECENKRLTKENKKLAKENRKLKKHDVCAEAEENVRKLKEENKQLKKDNRKLKTTQKAKA